MKPFRFGAKLTLTAAGASGRRFAIAAYSGGLLRVDGFDVPVVVDLSGVTLPEGGMPLLLDHQQEIRATLGHTDQIQNTGQQLLIAGTVTGASDECQNVLAMHDAGHVWQASIGGVVTAQERVPAGAKVSVNGQAFAGPVIVARQFLLRETSVVPVGGDLTTFVNLAAAAAQLKGTAMTFEDWLMSLGINAATLDETNRAALMLAFEAKQAPAAPAVPVVEPVAAMAAEPEKEPEAVAAKAKIDLLASLRKDSAAELRRQAEIRSKAVSHPLIAAAAIEHGWSMDKVELEVLKANQAKTRPTSFRAAEKELPQEAVLEAAMCMARKQKNVEKDFSAEILQAAHSQFRGRVGLQQVLILTASANGFHAPAGYRMRSASDVADVLAFACPSRREQHLQAAGFSTVSLPGILSNVANKELLQGYMEEDQVWREIADVKSVSDFKAVTSYRMLDNMDYEELGPGGTIKGGSLGEESYTRQVKTYAKMFALERTQIINDDLGAFDDLRNRVGRGAARKLNSLFWATFLGSVSTFWTSARTNYIEGATTNLGTDGVGLGLGVKAFRQRTSPTADGLKRLGGTPSRLLVPPELEQIADALYVGRNMNAVKVSDQNTHAGKYKPIVANQLSDSGITGYSTTAWWLLGDKGMGEPIVVSFLNGQETPTVENADADFNTLGIQFRGYHDFGCDMAEYMSSVRSKGAA